MDNKKEYILCAAIKRIAPKFEKDTMYYNNDLNNIEIGYRHHDILQRFHGEVSKRLKDQGFYTSKGTLVDRIDAMFIAWKAEQVTTEVAFGANYDYVSTILNADDYVLLQYCYPLYSEDLY